VGSGKLVSPPVPPAAGDVDVIFPSVLCIIIPFRFELVRPISSYGLAGCVTYLDAAQQATALRCGPSLSPLN
jgi:hypothetical protein